MKALGMLISATAVDIKENSSDNQPILHCKYCYLLSKSELIDTNGGHSE